MSSGHVYTVGMSDTTIVADATLIIVRAAAAWSSRASLLEVLRIEVGQRSSDTSDQLGLLLAQKASAFGTYTSATPAPQNIGGPASGITGSTSGAAAGAGVDASAEGAGTVTNIHPVAFNNLNGYLWVPTPEERILIGPDQAFIVKLVGTPSALTNWYAALVFEELN